MILIGQFDSPFVRRVGVALSLYGFDFEHRPWSVFGDADRIRPFNPLVRVPVLVLDDGEPLVDTGAILEHLDTIAPAGGWLWPEAPAERRRAKQVAALAGGVSDSVVSAFYVARMHAEPSRAFLERRAGQIAGGLDALEADRAARPGPYWFGERIGHADIAVAATLRHLAESTPEAAPFAGRPTLAAHCAHLEALSVFQTVSQPFIAPT